MPRSLSELTETEEPALPLIHDWIRNSPHPVELLPNEEKSRGATLCALQVTTRSPMGALAFETGGVLVDDGWIRILGGGCKRLQRTLASWNGYDSPPHRKAGALLVGDDAIGGFFAINGNSLPGPSGHVFYFAQDTLEWEDLDIGFSAWLQWAFNADLAEFYEGLRWKTWRADVKAVAADRAFNFVPPLFTKAEHDNSVNDRSRRDVPIEELWGLSQELAATLSKSTEPA